MVFVYNCPVGLVNDCSSRGAPASYSNLLESARTICADIVMSQQLNDGYASLCKSCMDWRHPVPVGCTVTNARFVDI